MRTPKNTLLLLVLFSLLFTGCGKQDARETMTVHFRFDSASDLKPGSRVVYLGTVVGQVPTAPTIDAEGRKVIVTARLDQLPEQLSPWINNRMTAQITRDDIITGGRQLTLHLSQDEQALPIQNGATLDGVNNLIELEAWKIMHTGEGSPLNRLTGLVFHMDRSETGSAIYVFNLVCFAALVLVLLAAVLDGIHMLLRGGPSREKGSPKALRFVWKFFAVTSLIRILALVAVILFTIVGTAAPIWPPYVLLPDNPVTLIKWEWRFLVLFAFILGLRFHWKFFSLPLRILRK